MKKTSTNQETYLSIIIPLYNEEKRLEYLQKIYKYLKNLKISYEIILINDGSTDHTLEILQHLSRNFKFNLISYNENRGKGFAIKSGALKAKGQFLLLTDIDLSTPIEEFDKFIPLLKKYDVIIGSRKAKGSVLIKRQTLLRELLGRVFTLLSRIVLGVNATDFTCGFKCFSSNAAHEIFTRQTIEKWGYDSELLYIAKKLGFQIKEVPVIWANNPRSKVKFPDAILTSISDLYKIRSNRYD